MKFAWTVAGDDPDYALGDKHEINGYFWPMFDSLTTKANLKDTVARGHAVGLYVVTNWPQLATLSPLDRANKIVAAWKALATGANAVAGLRLQIDAEEHGPGDPAKILAMLQEVRKQLPSVNMSWTMEAGQAGWMNDVAFRDAIISLRIRLVVQCYNGAMTEVWDTWAYLKTLYDGGYPASILTPFYDAAHLPHGWDGYAFTLGRLPA